VSSEYWVVGLGTYLDLQLLEKKLPEFVNLPSDEAFSFPVDWFTCACSWPDPGRLIFFP
jgi:hypothetical protein